MCIINNFYIMLYTGHNCFKAVVEILCSVKPAVMVLKLGFLDYVFTFFK